MKKTTLAAVRAHHRSPLLAVTIATSLRRSGALVCEDADPDLVELRKTIHELTQTVHALKAKAATEPGAAAELKAKETELQHTQLRAQHAELEAEHKALKAADKTRREADATAAVDAAVKRGALKAQDETGKKQWHALICADPNNAVLLAGMAGHPALGGRITTPPNTPRVEVGAISGRERLQAYSALVAQNAAINDPRSPEKNKLAREMGEIFAAELKGKEEEWVHCPLEKALSAADATTTALGTLAGTLVLQRNLPLLAYKYPILRTMFTDFSDAVGLWQQTEMTRIIIAPAVTEYDPTLDANGRPLGWVVVTPAQTVDVPITLSKHVGIPMIFGVQTLATTARNLFAEQSALAINALGGYFVDMVTALATAGNYCAYAGPNTDAGCITVSGSAAITLTSTAGQYPGQPISGAGIPTGAHIASVTDGTHAVMTMKATASATVTATFNDGKVPTNYTTYPKAKADFNFASLGEIGVAFDLNKVPDDERNVMLVPDYYQRLAQDPTFNTFFAAMANREIISKGRLPELNNFMPQKAPYFPTSSFRVGFAYHRAAMALKSRLPNDYTTAVSAMVPGSVTTVSDPDTGLSVLNTQLINLVGSYAENRIEAMLGANVGERRCGLVLTSQ